DLLNGFDLELATMLSGGLAHAVIILAEPHDSNLGVHFSGARSDPAYLPPKNRVRVSVP
ncbi:MAG: hypothetical protein ACJAQZ_004367, partial [Planctomycetota bacterium]